MQNKRMYDLTVTSLQSVICAVEEASLNKVGTQTPCEKSQVQAPASKFEEKKIICASY